MVLGLEEGKNLEEMFRMEPLCRTVFSNFKKEQI